LQELEDFIYHLKKKKTKADMARERTRTFGKIIMSQNNDDVDFIYSVFE
jgi:hypothetical protein